MTIKEVEKIVGMTSANIRYYEKEGLITPKRNNSNNYRDYSEEDIQNLEKIKVLRVLGVSIQDIHEIMNGEKALYDVMNCRLEELKAETKKIEEIEKTCQYIITHHMDYETMDSEVLEEKVATLKDVIKEVLQKDTLEEHITAKQLNATIGTMMIYGLSLSAVISLLFGNFVRAEGFTWVLISWILISFLAGLFVYASSNAGIQAVIFHVVTIPMAFAFNVLAYDVKGDDNLDITNQQIAGILFLIAAFLLIVMVVGKISAGIFRQYGKMFLLAVVCSAAEVGILYMRMEEFKVFLIMAIITAVANILTGLGWVTANQERSEYCRYHAIISATIMLNVVAMIMNQHGRNNSMGGRWGE